MSNVTSCMSRLVIIGYRGFYLLAGLADISSNLGSLGLKIDMLEFI